MRVFPTTAARLLIAGPPQSTAAVTADATAGADSVIPLASDLAARGVVRALCIGEPAPALDVPVDLVPFCAFLGNSSSDRNAIAAEGIAGSMDAEAHPAGGLTLNPLSQQLAGAARLLDEALAAASSSVDVASTPSTAEASVAYDDLPGESSDEEGGSSEGTRLRVRVSRIGDQKWGITWHANIFKMSQRLVVKEIADDSVMAHWNAGRAEHLQVGYGDRLMRINGVRSDDYGAAQAAEKMRAELKKPAVRALFWRPGSAGHADATEPSASAALPHAVLVCAGSTAASHAGTERIGAALAAAVVAAHALLHGNSVERELAPREGERNCSLDYALRTLGDARLLLDHLGATGQEILAALRILEGEKSIENEAERDRSAEPPPTELPSVEQEGHLDAAETEAIPQWTFSCRKCSTALFHDLSVLPHFSDGAQKAKRAWATPCGQEGEGEGSGCTSVFVEPMRWMGDLSEPTGRLKCGNPRCGQKLGGYSWHGLPCSCGQWQSPAFQIHNARIECMPAGRRARGPIPVPVFQA
mmetsp:Transcript_50036/g.88182  ORF Transcript_50036/g.88182 Transcript_50036/m.88182 type:complete len:530 (+) Transcript_50036:55-1644(+)